MTYDGYFFLFKLRNNAAVLEVYKFKLPDNSAVLSNRMVWINMT